jgi:Arc/MetJ-type ribon-helix-helix transcriptional regulator
MKTITINVSEPVYEDFRRASKRLDRSTSELIREAMELYRTERLRPRHDLRDLRPRSLGKVLKPLSPEDDLLSEMLHSET